MTVEVHIAWDGKKLRVNGNAAPHVTLATIVMAERSVLDSMMKAAATPDLLMPRRVGEKAT